MVFLIFASVVILLIAMALYSLEDSAKKALQSDTGQQSFYERGKAAYLSGNIDRAERYFTEHLKTHFSHAGSYRHLLKIYEDPSKQSNLLQLCQTILELGDRHISGLDMDKVRRSFADVSYERKAYEDALYHYLILLNQSSSTEIRKRVAYLYASQGQYQKAVGYYREVLKSNPAEVETKAALVPCLIGLKEFSEAIQILEELKVDGNCSRRDLYLLAKLQHDKGAIDESQALFLAFLKQSKWGNQPLCIDSMSTLMRDFYSFTKPLEINKLEFWIEVFNGFATMYKDSSQRLIELNWQLGFLLLSHVEQEPSVAARDAWMKVFNMDSEYKSIAILIDKLDEFVLQSREQLQKEYTEGRMSCIRFAGEPKDVDPRNFYHIPPIDIKGIEKALENPLMASFSAMFQSKSSGLDDMLSLSENMFELKITQVMRKMGLSVKETVSHNKSNKMSSFRVVDDKNEDLLCCAYQDSRKIGEVELRNVKDTMSSFKLPSAVVISLGSFSIEAAELARRESIRLISGAELKSMGYVN